MRGGVGGVWGGGVGVGFLCVVCCVWGVGLCFFVVFWGVFLFLFVFCFCFFFLFCLVCFYWVVGCVCLFFCVCVCVFVFLVFYGFFALPPGTSAPPDPHQPPPARPAPPTPSEAGLDRRPQNPPPLPPPLSLKNPGGAIFFLFGGGLWHGLTGNGGRRV